MKEDESVFENYVNFSLNNLEGFTNSDIGGDELNEREFDDRERRARKATTKQMIGEQHLLNSMCYGSKKRNFPPHHWYLNLFRNADELAGREKSEVSDPSTIAKHAMQKRKSVIAKGQPHQ